MPLPCPPFLPYDDIRATADAFLQEHWSSQALPVDIEKIVDARLKIDIISVDGLRQQIGVDGFLSRDGEAVYVDGQIADSGSNRNRYRFTLAHEVGHLVLQRELYQAANFRTPAEWLKLQAALPERDYSRYEYQAYCFAGLVLVPAAPLEQMVEAAIALARSKGYNPDLSDEADRAYVAAWVAREFQVSDGVILRRGKYDNLWGS
jgi:Zn-dependent peptidase ImmA (M78 family)